MNKRFYNQDDTIAAITTAEGDAAISAIRISGKYAFLIANKIFSKDIFTLTSHTAHYGKVLSEDKTVLDHVLLLVMHAPKTYTGENTIELFCHGGSVITKKVFERVIEAGACPALGGEFTFRAFMNNKIDLTQAEAVQKIIHSKNELSLQTAKNQLEGALSKRVLYFQKKLTNIAAILEAWVDFPEEGLEFISEKNLLQELEMTIQKMKELVDSFHDGKIIDQGISLCLIGAPNVGKSSLMNTLLGKNRAIVTEIQGTTRDVLEENLLINTLHFRLIDTAGIRRTEEVIEKEGIRRSNIEKEKADIVLLLLDSTRDITKGDQDLIDKADPKKTLLIWNKIDIKCPEKKLLFPFTAHISAKKGEGIHELKKMIENMIWKKGYPKKESLILTDLRHKTALENAAIFCKKVVHGLKNNISVELICLDIKTALSELSSIIGTNVTEDILSAIFSKFCIGK